jgi:hypothetical protein
MSNFYELVEHLRSLEEDDVDHPGVPEHYTAKGQVTAILQKYPAETKKMQQDGDVFAIYDTELYMALFEYFSEDMPYGTQKGRDGDPVVYINDEMDSLGLLDDEVLATKEDNPQYSKLQDRINELQERLDSFKQLDEMDPPDPEEIKKQNTITQNMNQLKAAGLDLDVSKPANDPDNAEEIGDKIQTALADPAMANQVKATLSKIKD